MLKIKVSLWTFQKNFGTELRSIFGSGFQSYKVGTN